MRRNAVLSKWDKKLTFDISDIRNFSSVCSLFVPLSTQRRSLGGENILQLPISPEKIYGGEICPFEDTFQKSQWGKIKANLAGKDLQGRNLPI